MPNRESDSVQIIAFLLAEMPASKFPLQVLDLGVFVKALKDYKYFIFPVFNR
jgi:hypothetical protein